MRTETFKDEFEPYYDNLDHIVEEIIIPSVSEGIAKYYECCRFKLKSVWYTERRVQEWDDKYRSGLLECISSRELGHLRLTEMSRKGNKAKCYFPFYEAMEFENLLSLGKSCLDCFSKALGSMYEQKAPNNISKLITVLETNSNQPKAVELLDVVKNLNRLLGVVIDPKAGKKSIRDLINHRERVDIFFTIREIDGDYTLSEGALLNMDHPELPMFPNYRVTNIGAKIHALLSGVIEKSFKLQFES